MNRLNSMDDALHGTSAYEAPSMELVEISIERGFEASVDSGFEGPTYGEEDVEW